MKPFLPFENTGENVVLYTHKFTRRYKCISMRLKQLLNVHLGNNILDGYKKNGANKSII